MAGLLLPRQGTTLRILGNNVLEEGACRHPLGKNEPVGHEGLDSLEGGKSGIEGGEDVSGREPMLDEIKTVPEANDKHGNDPEGDVAHLD